MTFANVVGNIVGLINGSIIPLLFALAFIYFLINIVRYFFIQGGEEGQAKGKQAVLYGLIGLVILFAVWGIVNLLLSTLNSAVGVSP
jgi:hypothetical protein